MTGLSASLFPATGPKPITQHLSLPCYLSTGLVARPAPRSQQAPRFLSQDDEISRTELASPWIQLEELYPDIAMCHIREESNVLKYFLQFFSIALNELTDDDFSPEFFKGFTPMTKTIIADQVFNMIPRYPENGPFNIQDVLSQLRANTSL
ncbi:hypothetical protein EDB83DRAFT_2322676 [Lactarius deliciosus]|nr:hypothetical protein EDB83DRAFT_2322676 [Lactarius deliciosus]